MDSMRKKYGWVLDAMSNAGMATKAAALKQFLRGKKQYLPKKGTSADFDAVIKCALCPNMCKFDCPVLTAAQNDAMSPSGKSRVAYFIETGRIDSSDAVDLMYACCNCDACREWCPFDFSAGDILRGVRADLVGQKQMPPAAAELQQHLQEHHVLDEPQIQPDAPRQGDVLYYMGCEVASAHTGIADAMTALLDDEPYAMLPREWCCGAPLYNLGFDDTFKEFARHNAAAIEESGCSQLVCSCPTCTYMYREIYPSVGVDLPVEVYHSTEYLHERVETGALQLGSLDTTCVYHDPCTLARELGITDAPRELLRHIGVAIAEAYYAGKNTGCCGRGGSLGTTHPDLASAITRRRIQELHRASQTIVTACPTCNTAFTAEGADVTDVTELLQEARERA
ncbi:MAG: (Fe-S)-binding protein [Thermoplasmatota archaeon]